MKKRKLHPIYYAAFVGTWKRTSINGQPERGTHTLTFYRNGTFDWPDPINEGTVNGEVETVEVDGGHIGGLPTGDIRLRTPDGRFIWAFSFTGGISGDKTESLADLRPGEMSPLQLKNEGNTTEEYTFHAGITTRPGAGRKVAKKSS